MLGHDSIVKQRNVLISSLISLFLGAMMSGVAMASIVEGGPGETNLPSSSLNSLTASTQFYPSATFAIAVFDPIPETRQRPIEIHNANFDKIVSVANAPVIPETSGMTSIVNLETLIVIYTNTAMGVITDDEIQRLRQQVSKTVVFIWKHSYLKLHLNLTYLIINDYKDVSEFTETSPGAYWLYPDDGDNDGQSIENDLVNLGVREGHYDSINIFWAHTGSSGLAYGGLGGLYWWSSLGFTGITMNPIAWWFYDYEDGTAFSHEIQHTIDFMFEASGYPDYFHADQPWNLPGAFGENWDFWTFGMQKCPQEEWSVLNSFWGTIITVPDNDGDDVPDDYLGEFPTEFTLGSSIVDRDSDGDHLEDLDEVIAGVHSMASLTSSDDDADGLMDGDDLYPLYGVQTQVTRQSPVLDGDPTQWDVFSTYIFTQNAPLSATLSVHWDPDFLYLMVIVDRYAGIHIQIDADGDGWFHGRDNYEIAADPSYPVPTHPYIIGLARIWDSSEALIETNGYPLWDTDSAYPGVRLITEDDIGRYARAYGSGYLVQLAVPYTITTGMNLATGDKMGLLMTFDYLDRQASTYASLFEKEAWVHMILLAARDATPPNSQMSMLPAMTTNELFLVDWNGVDVGSGLKAFDIQYRDSKNGQWANWCMQTTNITALFTGERGGTYYFRTRAWDKAGNVEIYPSGDGDTWTWIPHLIYLPTTLKD